MIIALFFFVRSNLFAMYAAICAFDMGRVPDFPAIRFSLGGRSPREVLLRGRVRAVDPQEDASVDGSTRATMRTTSVSSSRTPALWSGPRRGATKTSWFLDEISVAVGRAAWLADAPPESFQVD